MAMKILELFAGTASFSNVAKEFEHDIFTSDYDPQFDVHYRVNIFDFDYSKIPFVPDVIWASPPCESFSVASIGKHWNIDNTPKSDNAVIGMNMVRKAMEIIEHYNPKFYVIENPRGKLRKLPFMQNHPYRYTVTYCQYGDDRMKPTDLWTNFVWKPRAMCKNGMACHIAAPRGSRTGTQGISTYRDRSRIPNELCKDIILTIEGLNDV